MSCYRATALNTHPNGPTGHPGLCLCPHHNLPPAQLHLLSSAGIDVCLLCHFPSGDMQTNTARTLLAPAPLDQEPPAHPRRAWG